MEEGYKKLLDEMPKIAEVVKQFPESLQKQAFDKLVQELTGVPEGTEKTNEINSNKSEEPKPHKNKQTNSHELDGICTVRNDDYHFTVRDLKAKNAIDAAKRLVYVVSYSYMSYMNTDVVSRKSIINPILNSWRLNNGNTRALISNDPGIIQNGDEVSLDIHSEKEAEQFINDIKDTDKSGKWSPNSSSKKRKKTKE